MKKIKLLLSISLICLFSCSTELKSGEEALKDLREKQSVSSSSESTDYISSSNPSSDSSSSNSSSGSSSSSSVDKDNLSSSSNDGKCNGEEYDPSKYRCDDNSLIPDCNGKIYDDETHFCYGTNIYEKCGGEEYWISTERCEDGNKVWVGCTTGACCYWQPSKDNDWEEDCWPYGSDWDVKSTDDCRSKSGIPQASCNTPSSLLYCDWGYNESKRNNCHPIPNPNGWHQEYNGTNLQACQAWGRVVSLNECMALW
jgi:hypothetical protein